MPEDPVVQRLDAVIRLLAALVTQGKKQVEGIVILSSAGFQPKEIASLLGTTSNTVRVALSNLRRKGVTRAAKEKDAE
jgi:DNA-binding CsgD family transcriptional regulator